MEAALPPAACSRLPFFVFPPRCPPELVVPPDHVLMIEYGHVEARRSHMFFSRTRAIQSAFYGAADERRQFSFRHPDKLLIGITLCEKLRRAHPGLAT